MLNRVDFSFDSLQKIGQRITLFCVLSLLSFNVYGQAWVHDSKLISSNRTMYDYFGWGVSADGLWAAVSSSGDDFDSLGSDYISSSGAVFIYKRNTNNKWEFHQKINSSNRESPERFGGSVAIHDDLLLVGAPNNRTNQFGQDSLIYSGAVFVFRRDENDKWIEEAKLVANDRMSEDQFGWAVDIYDNWAIIGTPYIVGDTVGSNTGEQAGASYIFERDQNGIWTQNQKLISSDQEDYDLFGSSVGIFDKYIVIGAPGQDTDHNQLNYKNFSGAVYVFERDVNNLWNEKQKIVPNDRNALTQFGRRVVIDSNTVVCGVYLEKFDENGLNPLDTSGAVYVFEFDQNVWKQSQKIVAPDRQKWDHFGWNIDVWKDLIVVGALFESDDSQFNFPVEFSGSAYIFKKLDSDWQYMQKLKAFDKKLGDWFGLSVVICDSMSIFVGSNNPYDLNSENKIVNAGSLYTFYYDIYSGAYKFIAEDPWVDIYPNPTGGEIFIEFPEVWNEIRIRQISLSGQILQDVTKKNTQKVHLNILGNQGIYFLQIYSGLEMETLKIIKK